MTEPAITPPRVHWNDPEILAAAGMSPDAIRALLSQMGQPCPSDSAIYQWKSRSHIPDVWRASIVYALLATQKLAPARLFRRGSAAKVMPNYRKTKGKAVQP
jgi:hypothetical protein